MDTTDTLAPIPAREAYHAVPPAQPDAGFDARWAAWLERGRIHNRLVRQRLSISSSLFAMGAVGAGIMLVAAYGLLRDSALYAVIDTDWPAVRAHLEARLADPVS